MATFDPGVEDNFFHNSNCELCPNSVAQVVNIAPRMRQLADVLRFAPAEEGLRTINETENNIRESQDLPRKQSELIVRDFCL